MGLRCDYRRRREAGAGAAREAVAEANPFDVVILDRNMPEIDGYGLARLVHGHPRLAATPMVMLTSSGQPGDSETNAQFGIAAHLTKPVRAAPLRRALNAALAHPEPPTARKAVRLTPNGGHAVRRLLRPECAGLRTVLG